MNKYTYLFLFIFIIYRLLYAILPCFGIFTQNFARLSHCAAADFALGSTGIIYRCYTACTCMHTMYKRQCICICSCI